MQERELYVWWSTDKDVGLVLCSVICSSFLETGSLIELEARLVADKT